MLKHRKHLLLFAVLFVVVAGLLFSSLPRNEPKYGGRYLSEWLYASMRPGEAAAARKAIDSIGTNGLPLYLDWMGSKIPQWKWSVYKMLPSRLSNTRTFVEWVNQDLTRLSLGASEIQRLGTNAMDAIPELKALLHSTDGRNVTMTACALAAIGGPAIPVLSDAFADTNNLRRTVILYCLRRSSFAGNSNECMSVIISALQDPDARVRALATNLLQATSVDDLRSTTP